MFAPPQHLVGAIPRRPAPPNATFGSQMARFARPYCATEPVRTVPFFNLYDDIHQLGAFTDEFVAFAFQGPYGFHGSGRPAASHAETSPSPRLLGCADGRLQPSARATQRRLTLPSATLQGPFLADFAARTVPSNPSPQTCPFRNSAGGTRSSERALRDTRLSLADRVRACVCSLSWVSPLGRDPLRGRVSERLQERGQRQSTIERARGDPKRSSVHRKLYAGVVEEELTLQCARVTLDRSRGAPSDAAASGEVGAGPAARGRAASRYRPGPGAVPRAGRRRQDRDRPRRCRRPGIPRPVSAPPWRPRAPHLPSSFRLHVLSARAANEKDGARGVPCRANLTTIRSR